MLWPVAAPGQYLDTVLQGEEWGWQPASLRVTPLLYGQGAGQEWCLSCVILVWHRHLMRELHEGESAPKDSQSAMPGVEPLS